MIGRRFAGLYIISFVSVTCSTEPASAIKTVNSLIASINDSIQSGSYSYLEVNETSTSEGSPATLKMYFKGKRIILITASVGHETWVNEFSYYYYPNGQPMKYLKETRDRPDNPAKEAIIYSSNGVVVWKNTDAPVVPASELYDSFLKLQEVRAGLSAY